MYKNLKTVECLENGNYHVYRKTFPAKQHFLKWIPAPEKCKNQGINRIKSKKNYRTLKLCTLANNNLILSYLQLTLNSGSIDCLESEVVKTNL